MDTNARDAKQKLQVDEQINMPGTNVTYRACDKMGKINNLFGITGTLLTQGWKKMTEYAVFR